MPSMTFRLANAADISDRITLSVSVDRPVPDEWLQGVQNYFAGNLPPDVTWENVHRFSLQIEESREIDPSPSPGDA